MLFAGHETTGLTLFWACLLLANAPEWQDAVREEARSCDVSPSSAGEALARLPLTRAVVEETSPLDPPVCMSARAVMDSHDLCDLPVRGGSRVLLPFCMLHRNPAFWTSPSRFDPSRFLDAARPDRFTFLPFGAGPRVCNGAQLAVAESMLVLARLLRGNAIAMEHADPVQPIGSFSTRPSRVPMVKPRRGTHQAPAKSLRSRSRLHNRVGVRTDWAGSSMAIPATSELIGRQSGPSSRCCGRGPARSPPTQRRLPRRSWIFPAVTMHRSNS